MAEGAPYSELRKEGEEAVRFKLGRGAYGPAGRPKRVLAEAWLASLDAERKASTEARQLAAAERASTAAERAADAAERSAAAAETANKRAIAAMAIAIMSAAVTIILSVS